MSWGNRRAQMMEEHELEEGEAPCYYKDDDDDTNIDPDIDSYIDEKLQSVLGHFRKDFEGGVFAENLGAKFGGYGSFLPTYQRSPTILSQPRTPLISQNQGASRSPNHLASEGPPQNSMAVSDPPPTRRNGTAGSARQDSCFSAQESNKFPAKHDVSMIKSLNPTDQRTLKLRIRVGSDKTAQKTTALHTSLGLISPSSSMENSPTESGEMLSKFQEIHSDSPSNILQTMTSFPVAGSMLLSPLHEKLLTLSRNEKCFVDNEHVAAAKDTNPQSLMSANGSTSRLEYGDVLIRKKTKSVGKSEYAEELNSEVRNDTISLFQKNLGTESLENRHCFSNDLNQRVLPDLVCDTHESVKVAGGAPEAVEDSEKDVPMKKREIKRLKDQLFGSDLDKDDSLESSSDLSGDKYDHQEVRSRSVELQFKSIQKNASFDSKEGGRSKCSRSVPSFRADSDVSESERDSSGAVSLRKKVVMKAASHKPDQPRIPHTEKQSSEGKKKLIEHQPGLKPAADVAEVRGVSVTLKNKKSSKKDVRVAHVYDAQLEKPTNQLDSLSRPPGDKLKKSKLEACKGQQSSSAKSRQVPSKKVDSHVACVAPMKDPSAVDIKDAKELASEAEPPVAPVVIEEDWVACDKCETWRLLPYGTKPEHLPERWMCSMLYWLPGMNRCDISEGETTRALHALYQMPLPDNLSSLQNHAGRSAAGVVPADMLGSNSQNAGFDYMANGGKKKHKLRETPNTSSNHGPLLTTNSNLQHELVKRRNLKNVNQPVAESNSISKSNAQIPLKSSDVLGKHLNKPKERMANGDEKPKKKAKRESDQYDHRDLKKLKIKSDQAFVATREVVTGIQDYNESGNLKETKPGVTERLQILEKKHGNRAQDSRNSGSIDVKTNIGREISVKKRKLRDQDYLMNSQSNDNHLRDSDGNAIVREVSGESGSRKQKKPKAFHSEKKESSTSRGEEKSRTRGTATRIVLPGTRDFPIDRSVEREHQTKKYRVKVQSRLTMEDIDSLKKDLGSEQLSTAATSSSSKVSDSRKRRANHQAKGSPVGSVSSSPMRMFITSKASPARMESSGKDDAKLEDIGNSHMGNSTVDVLEECSPYMTEKHAAYCSDGKGRVSKKHVSMPNEHKSAKDSTLQFKENAGFNTQRVEEKISDQMGTKEVLNSKIDHNYLDSSTKSFKTNQKVSKKDPTHCSDTRREHRLKHDGVGSTTKLNSVCDMEGKVLTKQKPPQEIDARIVTNGRSTQTESRDRRSQVGAHAEDKLGTSVIKSKPASGSQKGSLKDVGTANTSVSARVSTMLKDPGIGVCQNVSHNSMGHLEPDHCVVQEPSAPTPSKRETSSQTASTVLREAEDLRDVADRLKNSGFHAEYNEAYFQAALKFLQGASLLESSNGGSSKSGEMNQIQIYSITAKLCETCALEYEKRGEAATAALAYKCMEVAYMRVVYCKNMSSSRIWHDLQASLQVPHQGESPSSSASDVDNTNNQTVAEKTALSRGCGSHAGNHVIAPRNRPSFVRLLDFTKDVNSAMEASRKAQNAFAAATNLEEAENKDAIISVKRVIDFSFQDVEELIRLVKQAIEAINNNGFGGSRG
ncbi:cysteine-tryptophan domain-containing zinc finger protein 7-like isoform X1 [Lycium barbarum]|uniref:cysteine-tryptophan domain-containing zinc finger protein 7-like isoform X1 n=1 Tax=Lycium barbarum TaxID=112863 RepID=UPI00293EEBC0|nr:cysteine-tryptophan domain-containing zinc finger protein 7-like isoform X1 [Lycium barbarum]